MSDGYVAHSRQKDRSWRYPNAAIGQVETIVRLQSRNVHRDFFAFALFVEVGTGDIEETRQFLLRYLDVWKQAIAEQRARFTADPTALHEEAAAVARRRGKKAPFSHRVRATLDERTLAPAPPADLPLPP